MFGRVVLHNIGEKVDTQTVCYINVIIIIDSINYNDFILFFSITVKT